LREENNSKLLQQTGIQVKIDKISNLKSATWRRLGKPALLLAVMMTGLFLTACATAPGSSGNFVPERAQDRWDALLAGDYETAYAFYSPGYRSTASVFDLAFKIRSQRVQWVSAEYRDHSCNESVCTVNFMVGFKIIKPVKGLKVWENSSPVEEKWVKTEGQWWYLPKQ
jgi:hypothetical protein